MSNRRPSFLESDSSPAPTMESVTVRVDAELLARLDRIVEFAQRNGHTDVTRSYLVRDALDQYVAGAEESAPEITQLELSHA